MKKGLIIGIVAVVIILVVIGIIVGMSGKKSNNQTPSTSSLNVDSKTSGYTLNDCYNVCKLYCTQTQIDICRTACNTIGGEGMAMDKIVNGFKTGVSGLKC